MNHSNVTYELPEWVDGFLKKEGSARNSIEERMHLAIALSRINVEKQTGGPFGAAIFEQKSGKLVAVGVNRVIDSNCSVIHAEILAIMLAQKTLGTYDLRQPNLPDYQLVSSTEPCAMCLGAVYWSGVKSLVIGARDQDAREVGFDEGIKPENWHTAFEAGGIFVTRDILRTEALSVLDAYAKEGGVIYNPGVSHHHHTE